MNSVGRSRAPVTAAVLVLRRAFRIRWLAVEELRLSQQRFEFVALATPEQRWAYPPGNVIFVAGPEGSNPTWQSIPIRSGTPGEWIDGGFAFPPAG